MNRRTIVSRCVMAALAVAAGVGLGGCDSYALRGRVVSGGTPMVLVVSEDDPQLEGPGVTGAGVALVLDPDSLGRKPLGQGVSDGNGHFSIPVEEFGAGSLLYEVGATARREGFAPVRGEFIMPKRNQRLLIVMVRGQDRALPNNGTIDAAQEFLEAEDARSP